jgi:peptide/nickel transport system ATP-binding protein
MLLSVKDLSVQFPIRGGIVTAVDSVSFDIDTAQTLAIVGESGSGKSVTSLAIMGLLSDTGRISSGSVEFEGLELVGLHEKAYRDLRGNKMAMIFQEPMTSLNPVYRVGDQIVEAILAHTNENKKSAYAHAIEMLKRVGIPEPEKRARDYPHQMSGGMRQRVMIAMALSCNPALLIADEPTTALDVTIQAQILNLINRLREDTQMSVLLVTHDLGVVSEVADYVVVMYCGQVVEASEVRVLFEQPLHPYTLGLLKSVPGLDDDDQERLYMIKGMVPNPLDLPPGCHFSDRCDSCMDVCGKIAPELRDVEDHQVRCHLFYDALGELEEEARAEMEAEMEIRAQIAANEAAEAAAEAAAAERAAFEQAAAQFVTAESEAKA